MNLYVRLFLLLTRLYFKPQPIDVFAVTRTKLCVLPNDLDLNMHMNNGRYLTVMDLGRIEFILRNGLLKLSRKHKWMPIAGAINIEYLRPLKLWQKYTINTQCIAWDEKWFYLAQKFMSNDKIVARAVVKALFRGRDTSVAPLDIIRMLDHDEEVKPNIPQEFKHLMR